MSAIHFQVSKYSPSLSRRKVRAFLEMFFDVVVVFLQWLGRRGVDLFLLVIVLYRGNRDTTQ